MQTQLSNAQARVQSTVQAELLTCVSSSTYLQWLLPVREYNCGAYIQMANAASSPTPMRSLFSGRWGKAEHRMTADRLAMIT